MATSTSLDERRALRRVLLAFFDARARDLPWRRTGDPYAIWVSEVMLQQTRVETVIPYFTAWMERFPDVGALAGADEAEVLKAWEGLGYYRRARALHRGAAVVRERFGGRVPSAVDDLHELPGVGAYTAGAVASIAFGEAVPAVDGNVRRVLSRLFDLTDPSPSELEELAAELVDPERPGDFNQALMELGATVCTPAAPACDTCPVSRQCLALERGTVAERPAVKRRKAVPHEIHAVAVVERASGAWLVRRRPPGGMLAGLWEFPGAVVAEGASAVEAALELAGAVGVNTDPHVASELPEVRHAYSHLHVTYRPVRMRAAGPRPWTLPDGYRWADAAELDRLALPVAMRRIADSVVGGDGAA